MLRQGVRLNTPTARFRPLGYSTTALVTSTRNTLLTSIRYQCQCFGHQSKSFHTSSSRRDVIFRSPLPTPFERTYRWFFNGGYVIVVRSGIFLFCLWSFIDRKVRRDTNDYGFTYPPPIQDLIERGYRAIPKDDLALRATLMKEAWQTLCSSISTISLGRFPQRRIIELGLLAASWTSCAYPEQPRKEVDILSELYTLLLPNIDDLDESCKLAVIFLSLRMANLFACMDKTDKDLLAYTWHKNAVHYTAKWFSTNGGLEENLSLVFPKQIHIFLLAVATRKDIRYPDVPLVELGRYLSSQGKISEAIVWFKTALTNMLPSSKSAHNYATVPEPERRRAANLLSEMANLYLKFELNGDGELEEISVPVRDSDIVAKDWAETSLRLFWGKDISAADGSLKATIWSLLMLAAFHERAKNYEEAKDFYEEAWIKAGAFGINIPHVMASIGLDRMKKVLKTTKKE